MAASLRSNSYRFWPSSFVSRLRNPRRWLF
jgi:hypothetical protein